MEEITSQRMLARLDRLDKFFAQCPGTKRGRPMDPGQAIHQEKANPGSVCMKISRARDGRGQRHIFYKVHSRAERAAQKTAQPVQNKKHETAEGQKPKASGPQSARATANPRTSSETPTFKSGVQGQSALQQKWGKVFHHQLERSLRGYIDSVMQGDSPEKAYVKEAWENLSKLDKAGSIFGLKGLSPKSIFWAMLTPKSAKILAGRIGKDLTSMSDGQAFARIIRSKFKDDPSFQAALTKGESWPVKKPKGQKLTDAQQKDIYETRKAHVEETVRDTEEVFDSFVRSMSMEDDELGRKYGPYVDEAQKNWRKIAKRPMDNADQIEEINALDHDPEKLFLKLLSPESVQAIKGPKRGRVGALMAKAKEKAVALKQKAMKVKESADEWQKKHPVLSAIGKGAVSRHKNNVGRAG